MHLWADYTDKTKNYEYLFDIADANGGDPEEHSVFNIGTLKALLEAGNSVADIVDKPNTKSEDLDLSAFDDVTKKMKLATNE